MKDSFDFCQTKTILQCLIIGQTLKKVGLYLESECFSHGQMYVGTSRVGSEKNLKIFAPQNKTRNVVYREALQ